MFFLLGGTLKTMFFFVFMAVSFKVAVNKQVCFYCTSNIKWTLGDLWTSTLFLIFECEIYCKKWETWWVDSMMRLFRESHYCWEEPEKVKQPRREMRHFADNWTLQWFLVFHQKGSGKARSCFIGTSDRTQSLKLAFGSLDYLVLRFEPAW